MENGFEAEAEAWVGGAERQTTATVDKHGSVSEGGRSRRWWGERMGEMKGEGNDTQGSTGISKT